ncbi:histidine phosphatase family protein [Colwelliaceae bacterium MEBiC 14330]
MLEIDLIRHVKVDGKAALYGRTDVKPLANENSLLLHYLLNQQKTVACYHGVACSPLKRCAVIANEFSALAQLPLTVIDHFQEMDFGFYDGKAFDELAFENSTNEGDLAGNWSVLEAFFQAPASHQLPQGEQLVCFHTRVIQAWQKLINQQMPLTTQQKQPRRLVVMAHGGVIRMIIAHILELDWRQASWYQQLSIGHASLSRISIRQFDAHDKSAQQIHQQVNIIGMPTF